VQLKFWYLSCSLFQLIQTYLFKTQTLFFKFQENLIKELMLKFWLCIVKNAFIRNINFELKYILCILFSFYKEWIQPS